MIRLTWLRQSARAIGYDLLFYRLKTLFMLGIVYVSTILSADAVAPTIATSAALDPMTRIHPLITWSL